MPKRKADNVTEAAQETPLEGAEQASHIEQIPTDASEGAESAATEILQHNVDNVTEAVQDATREDAEQVSRITQISTDAGEHAARAGTEILQRNVETIQDALQSSAEIAARLAERSADQFGRVFGISIDEAHKAAQKSSDNLDVIIEFELRVRRGDSEHLARMGEFHPRTHGAEFQSVREPFALPHPAGPRRGPERIPA